MRPVAAEFTRDAAGVATVRYDVVNGTRQAFGVIQCGPAVSARVDVDAQRTWREHSGGMCIAINLLIPTPLAPGGIRGGSVGIMEAGRYRIVVRTDAGDVASTPVVVR